MNPRIIGFIFAITFCQFGIDGGTGLFKCWKRDKAEVPNSASNSKFFDWFWQALGQKPSNTTTLSELSKPENCPPCKCGLKNIHRRIVGGVETKVNEYPWMAQLLKNGTFYCAGSVISDRYVLTVAHCLQHYLKEGITVRIGDHDRSSNTETVTKDYEIDRIMMHKNYWSYYYDNDIALIRVRGIFKFQGSMRPVCLAEKGLTYSGETGIVTGWGVTSALGPTSNKLLEVRVPIMSNNQCRSTRYGPSRITDNMMCAGYQGGGKDSCQGDSGGPMLVKNKTTNVHRIVGIVSWGEGCGQPEFPGVYTRVNRYLTWIEKHSPDACYCS